MKLRFFLDLLLKISGPLIDTITYRSNTAMQNFLYIQLRNVNFLYFFSFYLKNASFFRARCFGDICVVDYPTRDKRYEIVHNFLSVEYNFRYLVKTFLAADTFVPSLVSIFSGAN